MALFRISRRFQHIVPMITRATIRRENLFLLRYFRRTSAKMFGQTKIKKVFTQRQNVFF